MNKVKYVKVDNIQKMNALIRGLNITHIAADYAAGENINGGTIKGFYIFYTETKSAIEQTSFNLDNQQAAATGTPASERNVISEPKDIQEKPPEAEAQQETLCDDHLPQSILEYDSYSKKARDLERDAWNQRMNRIKEIAKTKNENSKE